MCISSAAAAALICFALQILDAAGAEQIYLKIRMSRADIFFPDILEIETVITFKEMLIKSSFP